MNGPSQNKTLDVEEKSQTVQTNVLFYCKVRTCIIMIIVINGFSQLQMKLMLTALMVIRNRLKNER